MSTQVVRYRPLTNVSDEEIDLNVHQERNASTQNLLLESSDDETDSQLVSLKRNIGIISGASIVVGSMIGSGIFIVPTGVLKHCNGNIPISMGVWVAGGFVAVVTALCFCELSTMLPHSGGPAAYLKVIYGDSLSFVYLWLFMFATQPQSTAVQVIALG